APFDGRHAERYPFFLEFLFVHGADFRQLVFMLEQVTALVLADRRHPRMADFAETAPQCHMPSGLAACGEVMMEPTFRRDEEASPLPIEAHELSSRRPHQ